MKTAFETLNSIKWGEKKHEAFTIHILDRINKKLTEIRFTDINKIRKEFMSVGQHGETIQIPLHRIREIRKEGKLIWNRE